MTSQLLSGRYEIVDRLGSGGMSTVYRATDQILERTVAVKILAEHLSDDERFVARFRREALAVAKLIHPSIVQVFDTGIDDGRRYIVMEYVDGKSGAQLLQQSAPLDTRVTVEIGLQACAGLDYAHRRDIIHRDVKPGNLMITGRPIGPGETGVKLTDFGIARATAQTRITQVGSVVGTAAYLAPEQVHGQEATAATDVYALGVVLYQFLTNRLPHEGTSLAELAVRQQSESPLPPSTYNSDVPQDVSRAVLVAIEGDADYRYASAEELAEGLRRGMAGEDPTRVVAGGIQARPVTGTAVTQRLRGGRQDQAGAELRPAPPARDDEELPPPVIQPARPARRSFTSRLARLLGVVVFLAVVAALVASAVIFLADGQTSVQVRDYAGNTIGDVVDELEQAVRENVREQ